MTVGKTLAREGFLPDFCNGPVLFNVILLAESLALVLVLIGGSFSGSLLRDLLLISLFVQWIAIFSAAALCMLRTPLNRLGPLRAGIAAWLLLVLIALVVGELATWVLWALGNIPTPHPEWYRGFQLRNLALAVIIDGLALHYFIARHQLRQSAAAEARARLQVMQYRLRPHFLFNSMNIIASLTRSSPDRAEAAMADLADLFRSMVDDRKSLLPVESEIAIARKYIELERIRFDQRLRPDWEVDRFPHHARMPVLMLQLALEVAVRQSVEKTTEPVHLVIRLRLDDGRLRLAICSNELSDVVTLGLEEAEALDNLRERLLMHYAGAGDLQLLDTGEGRCITLELPVYEGIE